MGLFSPSKIFSFSDVNIYELYPNLSKEEKKVRLCEYLAKTILEFNQTLLSDSIQFNSPRIKLDYIPGITVNVNTLEIKHLQALFTKIVSVSKEILQKREELIRTIEEKANQIRGNNLEFNTNIITLQSSYNEIRNLSEAVAHLDKLLINVNLEQDNWRAKAQDFLNGTESFDSNLLSLLQQKQNELSDKWGEWIPKIRVSNLIKNYQSLEDQKSKILDRKKFRNEQLDDLNSKLNSFNDDQERLSVANKKLENEKLQKRNEIISEIKDSILNVNNLEFLKKRNSIVIDSSPCRTARRKNNSTDSNDKEELDPMDDETTKNIDSDSSVEFD